MEHEIIINENDICLIIALLESAGKLTTEKDRCDMIALDLRQQTGLD